MSNLIEHFGIETTEITPETIRLEMDIDDRSHQPYGFVHGGMNAVLVETAASLGANYNLTDKVAMGIEVNVNHIRSKREGKLIAIGTKLHLGKRTAVYVVDIVDEENKRIASGRCSLQIVDKK